MQKDRLAPFGDLKVLDLSRFIAGPHCGMILADLGADVIKVEKPGAGEEARSLPPQVKGESLYLLVFNRNKRSITLNFRDPRAQEILRELVRHADVLIENFRPGTMEKMGCGWDVLSAINPRLVMTRISGFGQDGPLAQRPGFDGIAQAMSGLMSITGDPDGPPTEAGTFFVDYATALYSTVATLAALRVREQTGRGQVIDMALLDCAVSMLVTAIPQQVMLGETMMRCGNRDRYSSPANAFQTADGAWVLLVAGNDVHFPRVVKAAGLDALLDDPRFKTIPDRLKNADALETIIGEWMKQHPAEEVVELMGSTGAPCAKIATIDEVVQNPQLRHRGQIIDIEHPKAGTVTMHGLTMKMSETPPSIRRPAPSLGEHTAEVLSEWLGYTEGQIDKLTEDGVL
ncbi:MAG: CoA transferase [Rhodospirillales bacterium]|nr:CoA transferase [Rhodospirillales bacterium]